MIIFFILAGLVQPLLGLALLQLNIFLSLQIYGWFKKGKSSQSESTKVVG
jgi:nicotinamide riboside transporter PnuC